LKLSSAACEALLSHDWPGNIRELENAIIRGIHLSNSDLIEVGDIGLQSESANISADPFKAPDKMDTFARMKREAIQRFEKAYLTRLLSVHQGNVSQAARTAGKERRNLGRLLKKHGLDRKLFGYP
jgi:DNA-binding NtrC family response regulator